MRNRKAAFQGFTLVEILIVVSIVAMIAAFAIPNLMRARHNANETAAASALRTLSTALEGYRGAQTVQQYPVALDQLSQANPPYVADSVTRSMGRSGYRFAYTRTSLATYTLEAIPLIPRTTGTRHFYVDETGVLRVSASGPAGPGSPELE